MLKIQSEIFKINHHKALKIKKRTNKLTQRNRKSKKGHKINQTEMFNKINKRNKKGHKINQREVLSKRKKIMQIIKIKNRVQARINKLKNLKSSLSNKIVKNKKYEGIYSTSSTIK